MFFISILFAFLGLSSAIDNPKTFQNHLVKRQTNSTEPKSTETNSTANENPFASITPSTDLKWFPCFESSLAARLGVVSCARLIAPLDYDNPYAGNAQLAIIRVSGSGSNDTRKTVFTNPGGPGGDPIEYVLNGAQIIRERVGNNTDIVAVVPRGVGPTLPVMTCEATELGSSRRLRDILAVLPGYNNASITDSYAVGKSFGEDCRSVTPETSRYVGTVYVAQDMNFVRQALCEPKLSYYGLSYGTVLGGTYAALFPDKVGRMVFDAPVNFNDWYSPYHNPGFRIGDADLALANFFQFCLEAGADRCSLWSPTIDEIRTNFLQVDQLLFDEALPIPGYPPLEWPIWRYAVLELLYRPALGFPTIEAIASEILNGTAGAAISLYSKVLESQAESTVESLVDPESGLRNGPSITYLVFCSDSGGKDGLGSKQLDTILEGYQQVSSVFGVLLAHLDAICLGADLRSKGRYTKKFSKVTTSTPILFVGSTADPATPLRNARSMSEAFTGSSVLTIDGTGHVSFQAEQGSECAKKWILPYFQDGTLPPNGTICDGKQDFIQG